MIKQILVDVTWSKANHNNQKTVDVLDSVIGASTLLSIKPNISNLPIAVLRLDEIINLTIDVINHLKGEKQ